MSAREKFLVFIRGEIGQPYIYGGQSHDGWDCSGLVVGGMRAAFGDFPDMGAAALAQRYHNAKCTIGCAQSGCLLFYGDSSDHISHVMVVLTVWGAGEPAPHMVLVGAHGGDGGTRTVEDAWNHRACVGTVMGDYWLKNLQLCVDPFYQ
jgi:hypothetical protein